MSNGLTVLFDRDCGVCSHTARMLIRLDSAHRLRLVALQTADFPDLPPAADLLAVLHARDDDGRWFVGADAGLEISRRIPLLWPLGLWAKVPLGKPVLDYLYRAVADHRHTISRLLGLRACKVPVPPD